VPLRKENREDERLNAHGDADRRQEDAEPQLR
jgi:hypothetical protein